MRLFDQKFLLGDEGVALTSAWRISYGEIPDRDFFVIIPPFSFVPTALLFKFFGPSVLVGRLISIILAFGLIFILNLVLKKTAVDDYLRILSISLLIPFGVSYWPIPSHHWWCDLFCLLCLYFFLSPFSEEGVKESSENGRNLFLSGIFCALAFFTLQDQGGYLLILLISFILLRFIKKEGASGKKPVKLVFFL